MSVSDKYILVDKKAVPCNDVMKWATWYEASRNVRRVASTEAHGVRVSTIFLGLDRSFGEGKPLLFETMIFGGPHGEYQDRCTTWEEAEAMHAKACALAGVSS